MAIPIGQLRNAPLVYTLAVVRFSDIQKIGSYIPDIQEKLRKDFPAFEEKEVQDITFEQNANGRQTVSTNKSHQWIFSDAERKWGFMISPNILLFHTIKYEHFDGFGKKMAKVLTAIFEIAHITHYHTLGIRYIDTIIPKEGETLQQYLNNQLLPVDLELNKNSTTPIESSSQSKYNTDAGTLFLRHHIFSSGAPIPNDLKATAELLALHQGNIDQRFAVLDTDHVFSERLGNNAKLFEFNVDSIINKFDDLHRSASETFKCAVTEHALTTWNEDK